MAPEVLHLSEREIGLFFSLSEDFSKGELDLVVNEKVSHLVKYMYYATENITPEVVAKIDGLALNERYSQAFKVCQDVSISSVLVLCLCFLLFLTCSFILVHDTSCRQPFI